LLTTSTFGSNTLAHFWILKAFLPALIRSGKGHIVTVSSLLGLVGCAQLSKFLLLPAWITTDRPADYCASKAAVNQLYQSLRFELDSRYMSPEVKSTLLLPSFITTTLFSRINLPRSWLFNIVAPHLHPSDVVKSIISALDANESRVIRLPFYTNVARVWSVGVGIVPKRVIDLVQRFVGADFAMSEYGPKPDAAERLLEEKKTLEQVK
jgi:all-trans-retinol dehydrogenase (NAD+)